MVRKGKQGEGVDQLMKAYSMGQKTQQKQEKMQVTHIVFFTCNVFRRIIFQGHYNKVCVVKILLA